MTKFCMKSFDFSGSLSSFFAVRFVQAALSGENSLDIFQSFSRARDESLLTLFIVLVRSLLQLLRGFKSIVAFL